MQEVTRTTYTKKAIECLLDGYDGLGVGRRGLAHCVQMAQILLIAALQSRPSHSIGHCTELRQKSAAQHELVVDKRSSTAVLAR